MLSFLYFFKFYFQRRRNPSQKVVKVVKELDVNAIDEIGILEDLRGLLV